MFYVEGVHVYVCVFIPLVLRVLEKSQERGKEVMFMQKIERDN